MNDGTIIALISFIGGLIVVMAPVIKLNNNITRLTTVVEKLESLVKDKTDKLDQRVTEHGKQIDQLKVDVAKHGTRLDELEK